MVTIFALKMEKNHNIGLRGSAVTIFALKIGENPKLACAAKLAMLKHYYNYIAHHMYCIWNNRCLDALHRCTSDKGNMSLVHRAVELNENLHT